MITEITKEQLIEQQIKFLFENFSGASVFRLIKTKYHPIAKRIYLNWNKNEN